MRLRVRREATLRTVRARLARSLFARGSDQAGEPPRARIRPVREVLQHALMSQTPLLSRPTVREHPQTCAPGSDSGKEYRNGNRDNRAGPDTGPRALRPSADGPADELPARRH